MDRFLRWNLAGCLTLLMAAIISAAPVSAQTGTGGTYDESMSVGGRDRTYRVHVPSIAPPAEGSPMLIVLHGGGGNGKQVERSTGFSQLADREGFVVVYPDGSGRLPRRLSWNAHNCCAYAHAEDIDDVGFISALIDALIPAYAIDPARVYITGHSNGAMMTFRLACELSTKIASAAPYAGALNTHTCDPSSPVPILIMNGEDDRNVPVEGGRSPNVGYGAEDMRVDEPASYGVETWVLANRCFGAPIEADSATLRMSTWLGCAEGSVVEQVLIHDWEHGWPSPVDGAPIDASAVIWAFVSQFSKPQSAQAPGIPAEIRRSASRPALHDDPPAAHAANSRWRRCSAVTNRGMIVRTLRPDRRFPDRDSLRE